MASGGGAPEALSGIDETALSVLLARAARLRKPVPAPEDPAELVWVATFPLGEERFAFPLRELRAAIPLRNVTSVPLAPAGIVGIVRFEGALLTVFSLASLLGQRAWQRDPTLLLVVEPESKRRVAVDACDVPIAEPLARSTVLGATPRPDGITPLEARDGGRIMLIDLATLLAAAPKTTVSHG
jgi:CheW-like domain